MSRVYLSKPDITTVEEDLVLEALRSGWVAPLGPMVDRFEAEVCERVGVRGALALSSGTAALHLALLLHGAGPGTVVVVPSMTFTATANAVLYTGAEPVFVDAVSEDANLDVDLTLAAIDQLHAEGRKIVCVLSVDLFGRSVDYTRLVPGLEARGVALIEDAAEALGASHAGRAAGSFGTAAALSFNGNKIMTTSGGGMLLSDDIELIDRARYLSTQAREPAPWYEHSEMGFNYRMSNILAAIGVGQVSRLDAMIARRRAHRQAYADTLGQLDGVRILGRADATADADDNCWLTCIVLDRDVLDITVDDVVDGLGKHDIEARHLWKPMHLQPLYAGARTFGGDVCARLFETGIALPSGSALTAGELQLVIDKTAQLIGSRP